MDFYKAMHFVSAIFLGRSSVRMNVTMKTIFNKLKVKVSSESGAYRIIDIELEASSELICLDLKNSRIPTDGNCT